MGEKEAAGKPAHSLRYTFRFEDGTSKEFAVQLDPESLSMLVPEKEHYPEWTRLSFSQCSNCPLKQDSHPRCPIAANLVDLIALFRDSLSYQVVDVEIESETRKYVKRTDLQSAVSSLIGLLMVTSGCPVMDKLRPMAWTHLPFATAQETLYRAIGMYLMAQYFVARDGGSPDWELHGLEKVYEEVRVVNKGFSGRLAAACKQDAGLNALVHLDCFADYATFFLAEHGLEALRGMFVQYLKKAKE